MADQADELKVSRQTLMVKFGASFREMPKIPEEETHPDNHSDPTPKNSTNCDHNNMTHSTENASPESSN